MLDVEITCRICGEHELVTRQTAPSWRRAHRETTGHDLFRQITAAAKQLQHADRRQAR